MFGSVADPWKLMNRLVHPAPRAQHRAEHSRPEKKRPNCEPSGGTAFDLGHGSTFSASGPSRTCLWVSTSRPLVIKASTREHRDLDRVSGGADPDSLHQNWVGPNEAAGDSAEARASVSAFLESLDMRPLDTGALEMAHTLEWAGILLAGLARNRAGFDLALGAEVR